VVTVGVLQTEPGKGRVQIKGDEDLNHRLIHRKKQFESGIDLGEKGTFNLETTYRGEADACQVLIVQPLPRSHGVLAPGRVCKPFAHECWLIRHERWPMGSCIRIDPWPTSARVCKPERSCSQAATPRDAGEYHHRFRPYRVSSRPPIDERCGTAHLCLPRREHRWYATSYQRSVDHLQHVD
jgi:hypothetical protein